MKKLSVRFARRPGEALDVGVLAEDRGRVYFEYSPEFLKTGLSLSPFRLPFEAGLFEHSAPDFGPLPGLFDDSLPDGWGHLLMDRHFRSLGRDPAEIGPLERLSWLGARTMGALTYHPPLDREGADDSVFDLHGLARLSQEILAGAAVDVLPQLLRAGGSPGGARPKVLVGVKKDRLVSGADDLPEGYEAWLVKFPAQKEEADAGPLEYAYALMAAAAGVDMPPTRLFETSKGGRFFGVKRFDRDGGRRFHVHTFGSLIQSNFRVPSADYADLLKAASVLTRDHQEVLRAFRRMVFNAAARNRDDHVKNFAFLLDDESGDWRLSPAYDLVNAPGPGGEHSMTLAGEGRNPGREHVFRLAEGAGVSRAQASAVLDEVRSAVGRWKPLADRAGVSKARARAVAASFPKL
ncbi:MAG TPA: type II toxin-antitoxin system HipA family toxin [Elusimicrobiota bacterium]|jgi:serine/threonine-protein kinase HipA|nr:type II toxin-antitoxin system HipA family toxin [Elusimicrobiota bacterium]